MLSEQSQCRQTGRGTLWFVTPSLLRQEASELAASGGLHKPEAKPVPWATCTCTHCTVETLHHGHPAHCTPCTEDTLHHRCPKRKHPSGISGDIGVE